MLTKAPRGTNDIVQDSYKWQHIEDTARKVCRTFGYDEIRTPTFEHTELFARGVGDTTDVVEKQMYTFQDKGDRSITLKPEGTAGVARAYIERNLYAGVMPVKLYYITPCFRYEKPQAGRLREFHQFGIEVLGSEEPNVDVEIISLAITFLQELGLTGLRLSINSIGCPVCRKEYNEKLKAYFNDRIDELCDTCKNRLEKNPLRILDCKAECCKELAKGAPKLIDHICEDCKEHFDNVTQMLSSLDIEYSIDPDIVRGLDYYTKTVFEIISDNIGAQSTVCGGGRYDGLIEELGGPKTSGIGFALGIERLIMTMENQNIGFGDAHTPDIYIATIGKEADIYAEKLVYELRCKGISGEKDRMARSLKAQMKYADKIGAKYSMVLGDDEVNSGAGKLKNMQDGETKDVKFSELYNILK